MKLRALIVDDERVARQRLRRLLAAQPDVEVVAEAGNGPHSVELVREHEPNVVFLDIQMPGMNGFEVVEMIEPIAHPAIVFVTAFDKHAVHAFETCALDYLLKPVEPDRLTKTIGRVKNHLSNRTAPAPPPATGAPASVHRFSVRSGQRTSFVAPNAIDWIEADGNYAVLHVGGQNHLLRETMNALEKELPADDFLRVSRSAIVSLHRVKELHSAPGGHHFALLNNGQRVSVTRKVRDIEARLRRR